MREKYIILRTNPAATRDIFRGAISATALEAPVLAGVSVEVEEIDRPRISSLTRSSEVLAIAPVIPMKLSPGGCGYNPGPNMRRSRRPDNYN